MSVATPEEAARELIQEFEFFDDWEERYKLLIEMGGELDRLPPEACVESNRVQGCQSNVWLTVDKTADDPPRVVFHADSDSQIVRGLIAVLIEILSDRTPAQIVEFDVESVFDRMQLRQHLSRQRSNGLHAMIQRVRQLAVEAAAQ